MNGSLQDYQVRRNKHKPLNAALALPGPDLDGKPRITVRKSVKSRAKRLGLTHNDLVLPKSVILSLNVGVTPLLVSKINAREVPWIYAARPLYVGRIGRIKIGVIWAAPGSPLATMVMEDLISCGVRKFIGVGSVSSLQRSVEVGDMVIPLTAARDEGTSYHYLPKHKVATSTVEPAKYLESACLQLGVRHHIGMVWTTDAPYRETIPKIIKFQTAGTLGVDMETSAIFSLGMYHKVHTACLLAVASSLVQPKATMGFYGAGSTRALSTAVEVVERTMLISQGRFLIGG